MSTELEVLAAAWSSASIETSHVDTERQQLKMINEQLWDIEDAIRRLEAAKSFDSEFVNLAREVYKTNDKRAAVKKSINKKLGSALVEEKSYQPY